MYTEEYFRIDSVSFIYVILVPIYLLIEWYILDCFRRRNIFFSTKSVTEINLRESEHDRSIEYIFNRCKYIFNWYKYRYTSLNVLLFSQENSLWRPALVIIVHWSFDRVSNQFWPSKRDYVTFSPARLQTPCDSWLINRDLVPFK